jgi:adenylate cyclase
VLPVVWLIARAISRPLLRLAEEAEQIRHFRLAEQIDLSSHLTEVRSLATAMNSMKAGLRTFGLFVPKTLVRRMIEAGTEPALGGRRREITVLFTDVAGFTELSETMEPEALMQHLSIYLETLTRALMANGGTIDKYIGDAIMALWNAPKRDEDHAARACRAALLARVANAELDQRFHAQGLPVMQTRFGLHCGDAVVGNVGSSDRMNYTAIGASASRCAPWAS